MTGLGDPGINLAAGQLAALTGFSPLGHLDLQFIGMGQIMNRDPEAPGGHLFNSAVAPVAIFIREKPVGVLAPLAAVAAPPQTVHGDGLGFMGFLADRPIGHGTGFESSDDRMPGLHFIQWHGLTCRQQREKPAQKSAFAVLLIDLPAEILPGRPVILAHGLLKTGDGKRIILVAFPITAPFVLPTGLQDILGGNVRRSGRPFPSAAGFPGPGRPYPPHRCVRVSR